MSQLGKRPKSEGAKDKRVRESPLSDDQKKQQRSNFQQWGIDEVSSFLSIEGFPDYAGKFTELKIEGRDLPSLGQQDLIIMEIKDEEVQNKLLKLFSELCQSESKVFNDPIHGHIELHPLLVKIIDTPQFQRLKYIKQLGGCYFVFPGASHNRFEHSIGVCHLAGELAETLRVRHQNLGIDDKDILCVKMAGLCHDLGHGPFSHLFDGLFIPQARPGYKWRHEEASVAMLDHLIKVNNLQSSFNQYDITDTDLEFVKEQIVGPRGDREQKAGPSGQMQSDDWPYIGRGAEKGFLYQIVANKKNGIDVDKWDYLARDCHHLGITSNFDYRRFMKFVRVIPVDEGLELCTRDKEVHNLYDMFYVRNTLHKRAYKHKTTKLIEWMICEAFLKADEHLKIIGKDGNPVKLSKCIDDMYAYTNLNDHIFHQILDSTNPELKESQEILSNILNRRLYKFVGQTTVEPKEEIPKGEHKILAADIISSLDSTKLTLPVLTSDDLLVDVVTFDYGMRGKNPIDHVRFYSKNNSQKAVKVERDQVSYMLPERFTEQKVRVYCRKLNYLSLKAARQYFNSWCDEPNQRITPKGAQMGYIDHSPYNTRLRKLKGKDKSYMDSAKKKILST